MRLFSKIIVFFYTLIFAIIGVCLIFIALHMEGRYDLSIILDPILDFSNLYLVIGLSGVLLILVTLSLANFSFKKFQAEKTIGYSTNEGQVIISLGAIEDFIRRLTQQLPDVKELRSDVFVTRRGIEIESRVILWSTSNIPNITERIQSVIQGQVQELLSGIDRPVLVNVHVTKIAQRDQEKSKKSRQEIPFLR